MTAAPPRPGLDFDNTIVLYDRVFQDLGRRAGLLPAGFQGDKRAVRAHVRALPGGEALWTGLQAQVYGPGIAQARPAPGLADFLGRCRAAGIVPVIVSHKTRTAAADPDGADLRECARAWMAAQGLTDPARGGIPPENIFFEETRAAKIARIRALGCTHFVDDLEELFREPDFPAGVRAFLYAPADPAPPAGPWQVVRHWREVGDALCGHSHAA